MVELTNFFKLIDKYGSDAISTFHLAEGPGGFIEALTHMRQNKKDKYIGMTILDKNNDPTIPGWKKSENFLKENKMTYDSALVRYTKLNRDRVAVHCPFQFVQAEGYSNIEGMLRPIR
jgi:hypothetical protein